MMISSNKILNIKIVQKNYHVFHWYGGGMYHETRLIVITSFTQEKREFKKNMSSSNTDSSSLKEKIVYAESIHEHILLCPNVYVGSVSPLTENQWIYKDK